MENSKNMRNYKCKECGGTNLILDVLACGAYEQQTTKLSNIEIVEVSVEYGEHYCYDCDDIIKIEKI